MFTAELDFFKTHQDELVKKHSGKVLVLRDHEVVHVADSPLEAYLAAKTRFEPGTFMIQPCEAGPGAYTVTIASAEVVAAG
jgi:hypothetical protein